MAFELFFLRYVHQVYPKLHIVHRLSFLTVFSACLKLFPATYLLEKSLTKNFGRRGRIMIINLLKIDIFKFIFKIIQKKH